MRTSARSCASDRYPSLSISVGPAFSLTSCVCMRAAARWQTPAGGGVGCECAGGFRPSFVRRRCGYNKVNHIWACENSHTLSMLRRAHSSAVGDSATPPWDRVGGFRGFVMR